MRACDVMITYSQRLFGIFGGLQVKHSFRAAAVLNSEGKLLVHNASGEFPADWVRESTQAGGSSSADVRTAKASEPELLAWAAPEAAITGKRPAAKRASR